MISVSAGNPKGLHSSKRQRRTHSPERRSFETKHSQNSKTKQFSDIT